MKKTEKLLVTFITWIYAGIFAGLILGALFGGRGGMLFVVVGFLIGCIGSVSRTLYLGFTYNENPVSQSASRTRLILRRIIVGVLYVLLLHTIYSALFKPVQW